MLHFTPFLTVYFSVIAFMLGTVLASFLGCLGWRMCHGESVLKGRSHCDVCDHTLGARDLIPILSFIFNKGRCRHCGAKISPLNLYGEIVMGVLFSVMILIYRTFHIEMLLWLFFFCILYLVTVTDIYEQIIPDGALLVAIIFKVVHYVVCYQFDLYQGIIYIEKPSVWIKLFELLVDGLAVSLPLLILVLIMEKVLKKEAMGGGDIKLLFVTGLYLGWTRNILVVFFACIIGIIVGSIQQKKCKGVETSTSEKEEVEDAEPFYFAFGPSIAVSAVFVLFFGNRMIDWYLSLF